MLKELAPVETMVTVHTITTHWRE